MAPQSWSLHARIYAQASVISCGLLVRAAETVRNLRWFEVVQIRGHVEDGEVHHYQVMLKAGFTLEGEQP